MCYLHGGHPLVPHLHKAGAADWLPDSVRIAAVLHSEFIIIIRPSHPPYTLHLHHSNECNINLTFCTGHKHPASGQMEDEHAIHLAAHHSIGPQFFAAKLQPYRPLRKAAYEVPIPAARDVQHMGNSFNTQPHKKYYWTATKYTLSV
jgi:hypothetical protein